MENGEGENKSLNDSNGSGSGGSQKKDKDYNNSYDSDSDDSSESSSDENEDNSSFLLADESVKLVAGALTKLADVEYVAIIGRKNMQIMDRLSKMSFHKEKIIEKLSAASSIAALKMGEDLAGEVPYSRCKKSRTRIYH